MDLEMGHLLVRIEYEDARMNNNQIGIKLFNNTYTDTPFPCQFKHPLQALLAAYRSEEAGLTAEAEEFYKTATAMTSDTMFEEAYSFYRKRKDRSNKSSQIEG